MADDRGIEPRRPFLTGYGLASRPIATLAIIPGGRCRTRTHTPWFSEHHSFQDWCNSRSANLPAPRNFSRLAVWCNKSRVGRICHTSHTKRASSAWLPREMDVVATVHSVQYGLKIRRRLKRRAGSTPVLGTNSDSAR